MEFSVTVFLQRVDQIGGTYVQNAYQQLGQALTGGGVGGVNVAGLLLTLYVIFWGFGLWFGTQSGSPSACSGPSPSTHWPPPGRTSRPSPTAS
jgi:type IV secretion system protein VirB6